MKLVSFRRGGKVRIGAITEDSSEIVDFSIAAPRLPADMSSFIEGGDKALAAAAKALTTKRKKRGSPISAQSSSPRSLLRAAISSVSARIITNMPGNSTPAASTPRQMPMPFRRTRLSFPRPTLPCAGRAMKSRPIWIIQNRPIMKSNLPSSLVPAGAVSPNATR